MAARLRVIGPGRAGLSLGRALEAAGWHVAPALGRHDYLGDAAAGTDLLVIATPDAVVADVAGAVRPVDGTVVAHVAGSLTLGALAPHVRRASLHPLVSLPDADVGAARLRGATFAVAGDPIVHAVVDALGGRAIDVPDGGRAAYHAAACIASNHLVALLGQVERVAADVGVPLDAYLDLVRGTVANVAALGPASALTGPVARRDWETVRRHLDALDPSEHEAYEALGHAAARLAGHAFVNRQRSKGASISQTDRVEVFSKELEAARAAGKTVGLVPTMGYLHDGHASLIRRAARECDVVAVTVFVNPLQFGPNEDLSRYPRDLDGDRRLAEESGATVLFAPSVDEMYPCPSGGERERGPVATTVHVDGLTDVLEGASRPGHFDGVATVVAKLFAMAGRCRAYFGEKDFQQLAVIRRMARDLSFPVDIVGCPTVREPDGLAMSSRNVYLSTEERAAAPVLHRALQDAAALVEAGERDPNVVRAALSAPIDAEPLASVDYAEVVDADDLTTPDRLRGELRLLVAARFGNARLIDNVGVNAGEV